MNTITNIKTDEEWHKLLFYWRKSPKWASASHSDTPHSVGLLWTSNQPHTENSTWQHTTLTTDRRAPCPQPHSNRQSSQRAAAEPRLRPRDHWDALKCWIQNDNTMIFLTTASSHVVYVYIYIYIYRTSMTSRTAYSISTPMTPTLFSGHYLRNRSTLDIGVLGYIGIV